MTPHDSTHYMAWTTDLARRYCADSGFSPEVAQHVAHLLGQGWGEDFSRIPEADRAALEQTYADAVALSAWSWDIWRQYSPAVDTRADVLMYAPPDFLPDAERRAIVACAERAAKDDESGHPTAQYWRDIQAVSPACAANTREWDAGRARVLVRGEELRAYLTRFVREATGRTEWLWPDKWLTACAPPLARLHDLSAGCMHLLRQRAEDAERRAREAEQRRRPTIRQGTAVLRAWMQRPEHVTKARRTAQQRHSLTKEQAEARKLFEYQPLGMAERAVLNSLAAIAREEKKLDVHPWAKQRRPVVDESSDTPAPRVQVRFPGFSKLAHIAGAEPDARGRISKEDRELMERALRSLCTQPRWIAEPVLVRQKGPNGRPRFIEDVRVTQTLWIEASGLLASGECQLNLHPIAIASHLASYVEIPNYLARCRAAVRQIGLKRFRDEMGACDDYLRLLAMGEAGRRRREEEENADGGTPRRMVTAGEEVFFKDLGADTLRDAFGLGGGKLRDRGATVMAQRLEEALAYSQAMGTIRSFELVEGKTKLVYRIALVPPDVLHGSTDPDQVLLFPPEDEEGVPCFAEGDT